MKTTIPSSNELRKMGLRVLREKLGASGMARFLRDYGFVSGNYTEERSNRKDTRTIDDLMKEMDKTLPSQPQK